MAIVKPAENEIEIYIGTSFDFSAAIDIGADPTAVEFELSIRTPTETLLFNAASTPPLLKTVLANVATLTCALDSDITAKIPPHRASRYTVFEVGSKKNAWLKGGIRGRVV
ncbi:MAG: hypothetical protein COB36_11645 [Alphaproteobacteria bacterium]|nr:MAG: hypothetical protein COB36_11645 [Alphaproteobacteria bacterium]